jgi:hypothetical protein
VVTRLQAATRAAEDGGKLLDRPHFTMTRRTVADTARSDRAELGLGVAFRGRARGGGTKSLRAEATAHLED